LSKAEAFCRVVDNINERTGRAVSYLILPLLAITVMEVILRYIFNRPTIWSWDVNIQLLSVIGVMGAGYTLFARGHVIVDVIVGQLSPRKRAIIDLITALLFFLCVGALVYQGGISGWKSMLRGELYTSVWEPPIYVIKMLIPVGAFLLLLQGIAKFIRDLNIATQSKQGHTQ